MKALFLTATVLAFIAGISTTMIPKSFACGEAASAPPPHYMWQYGYGKDAHFERHLLRVE
jgi:hypothetical protein